MRTTPLLLAVLVLVAGGLLLLSALYQRPAAQLAEQPVPAAGAGPAVGPQGPVPQGHVYAGITEEPDTVNPFTAHGAAARRFVLGLTHEGLLDIDPESVEPKLRPALAAAFAPASDGMSCVFTLREGVRFCDGSPLTMADVMFGWELARAGHLEFGWAGVAFARVRSAEALDERRLLVNFRDRHYAAVRVVGEAWLVGKRQFFVDRVAANAARQGLPAPAVDTPEFAALLRQIDRECGPGTGPYMLPSDADGPTTWRRRQDLLLTQNPHCWRREAMPGTWNLAGVRLLFRDGVARFATFVNGEIDWYGGGPLDAILRDRPELAKDYTKLVYDSPTVGVLAVIWNCRKPALADRRVRRALGMLVDQPAIVAQFDGEATAAVAFAKPHAAEYPVDLARLPCSSEQAGRLLREAGFGHDLGKPLQLDILAPQGPPAFAGSLDLLVGQGQKIGVEIKVRTLEYSAYVAALAARAWDGVLTHRQFFAWGDPYDFVHSTGLDNEGGFLHPEVDRLAAAARVELDPVQRASLLRQMHELVYEEQPVAFFVHPLVAVLFNRHIENGRPGPLGLWPERFWVEPRFQRR